MTTYTQGQDQALKKLINFIPSKRLIFRLAGSAGTGKTFLMQEFSHLELEGEVLATAPTHKAVGVLAKRLPDCEAMTIHKFLGLRPTKKGDTTFLKRSPRYDPSEYFNVKYVIIDEASMVDSQLAGFILQDAETWERKYILVGDRYQLPPVNDPTSPLFDLELTDECQHELTEIVRQAADNPIIGIATAIRDAIISGQEPPYYSKEVDGKGVFVLRRKDWVPKLKEFVTDPRFSEDPDFFRLIAYTNDRVMQHIQNVRSILGEDLDTPFSVGDNVTANEAWIQGDDVIFNTGSEFTVMAMEPHTHPVYQNLQGWQVWLAGLEEIPVYILDILKCGTAIKSQKGFLAGIGKESGDWRPYYELTEYFADLRLLAALTAHKSQGSTFKNVFIDFKDIYSNRTLSEADRCFYVAVTRPSDNAYIMI